MQNQPKIFFNYLPSAEENLSLIMFDCDFLSAEKQSVPLLLWKM